MAKATNGSHLYGLYRLHGEVWKICAETSLIHQGIYINFIWMKKKKFNMKCRNNLSE